MSALFASGRIVDLILLFTVCEAVALTIYHRRTGRGIAPADMLSTLLSGACLMAALRFALTGAWWGWTALSLMAALLAHLADLRRKWSHASPAPARDGKRL